VADEGDVAQVEVGDEVVEVVGEGVEVVAVPGLVGAAVAAAAVGDGAVAVVGGGLELVLPGVAVQRPAVDEQDGAALPPVAVVDLDAVACGKAFFVPFR
jgi:hypothetical protein